MMQALPTQLTLGLSLKDEATFENFYAGANQEIIAGLKQAVQDTNEQIIYLCGARGDGLSHLLQACCHAAHQQQISSVYLPLAELLAYPPDCVNGFENLSLICIDDVDAIANHPEWEEAIFHLFNRIYDNHGKVIFAAHDLPKAINLQLPDLVSRLSWGIIYSLHPLNDDEKLTVFMARAKRRGITMPEEVAKFILNHCPRHMTKLFMILDSLDKASLAAKRRLTIPFVKEVLSI